jgi:hypothetical protein
MSSFYGSPTLPSGRSGNRLPSAGHVSVPTQSSFQYPTEAYPTPQPQMQLPQQTPAPSPEHYPAPSYGPSTTRQAPNAPTPGYPTPLPSTPARQSDPSTPSLYEQVPPAPLRSGSPSDRDSLDLPSPKVDNVEHATPEARRPNAGSFSLIQQSMFRNR